MNQRVGSWKKISKIDKLSAKLTKRGRRFKLIKSQMRKRTSQTPMKFRVSISRDCFETYILIN
jgi:hypothetical protein